jgi:hypothetical protein
MADVERDEVRFFGDAMAEDVVFRMESADEEDLEALSRAQKTNARQSGARQIPSAEDITKSDAARK